MTQPAQPVEQPGIPITDPDPMKMRLEMVANAQRNASQPDAAQQTYDMLGFSTKAALAGHRVSVSQLKAGDLVGWEGGHEPDGRYIGNMAIYAGNGEIIEKYFDSTRRRKLDPHENTFGLPVVLPDDSETNPADL